jgi:hypothetical protein
MLFNGNYINKAISSVLLVMLLLVHSIKLLHTHSGNNSFSNHNCRSNALDKNAIYQFAKSSADCSICNYQIGKDADDLVYPALFSPVPEQMDFNLRLISSYKPSHPSLLESRGPPAFIL